MKKKLLMPVFMFFVMLFAIPSFGHGGGIDANGGHHDYNNVSGLGSYHYHCDGHSAHLHTDGVCPFSSDASTSSYASQLAKKEPVESDFNSAGRKDYSANNIKSIESPEPTKANGSSLFKSTDFIACSFFAVIYIAALLYRIFVSKELYYFPFVLSILSLIWMIASLFLKETVLLYIAGISATINLFCEK